MKAHLPLLFFACLAAALPGTANSSSPSNWTSNDGVTIRARFLGAGPESVLIDKDGVVFHVPFARLSPASVTQARKLGGFGGGGDSPRSEVLPSASIAAAVTKPEPAAKTPGAAAEKLISSSLPQVLYARMVPFGAERDALSRPSPPAAAMTLEGRVASALAEVPGVVQCAIDAGNVLQTKPYKWGGGRAPLEDTGYDCSGSVSYVLIKAGLLRAPLTSRGFTNYGEPGPGKWITIYARPGHVFMTICGLRLDTGGRGGVGESGPRWSLYPRNSAGCSVRHPPGF